MLEEHHQVLNAITTHRPRGWAYDRRSAEHVCVSRGSVHVCIRGGASSYHARVRHGGYLEVGEHAVDPLRALQGALRAALARCEWGAVGRLRALQTALATINPG